MAFKAVKVSNRTFYFYAEQAHFVRATGAAHQRLGSERRSMERGALCLVALQQPFQALDCEGVRDNGQKP